MDQDVTIKFKHFISKRMLSGVVWSVVLQAVFILVFIFLMNTSVFHVWTWFGSWFGAAVSPGLWLKMIPLAVVITVEGLICGQSYISVGSVHASRFSAFCSAVSIYNVFCLGLHVVIGGSIAWIYSSLLDFPMNSFWVECGTTKCLSEGRFFLVVSGFWTGFYYFFNNSMAQRPLVFSLIQQHKFVQVKTALFPMIKESFYSVLIPGLVFVLMYYFRGNVWSESMAHLMTLPKADVQLDSMFSVVFDLKRIFYLYLITTVCWMSLRSTELLFKVFLTERYEFSLTPNEQQLCLETALKYESSPIIQSLGYLDLVHLAEHSEDRRALIYSVSTPGGHAYIWTYVKRECFDIITKFTTSLETCVRVSRRLNSPKPKSPPCFILQESGVNAVCPPLKSLILDKRRELTNWLWAKLILLNNIRPIGFVFSEVPEIRIKILLLQSQRVVWAAKALTALACHSLLEDQFGVLQNDLSSIISLLIKLKHTTDEPSIYFSTKNPVKYDYQVNKLRQNLRSSVKRCIYDFVNHFRPYLADLQLSRDVRDQLNGYIAFKE